MQVNNEKYLKGDYACESHHIFKLEKENEFIKSYVIYSYNNYTIKQGEVIRISGKCTPAIIIIKSDSNKSFEIYSYWEPQNGENYSEDIKNNFLKKDIDVSNNKLPEKLENECDKKALSYFENK